MSTKWIAAVTLSAALLVACGEREPESAQITPENEGTSVTLAPGASEEAGLDASLAAPAAVSPNRDRAAFRPDSSGANPTVETRAPAPRREAAPPAPRVTVRTVTLPAGTALPLELTSAVSTETAHVEMPVSARLRRAVSVDGLTVFPAGAIVNGEVIDVDRPGRVQGRARLGLRFTSVTIDGRREAIRSDPVMFEGEASRGEDATKIGAGAGLGAVIGGIVGGGDGAAKGAAIGGAAGTGAVLATRGKDVALTSGTDIDATLASAVDVDVR